MRGVSPRAHDRGRPRRARAGGTHRDAALAVLVRPGREPDCRPLGCALEPALDAVVLGRAEAEAPAVAGDLGPVRAGRRRRRDGERAGERGRVRARVRVGVDGRGVARAVLRVRRRRRLRRCGRPVRQRRGGVRRRRGRARVREGGRDRERLGVGPRTKADLLLRGGVDRGSEVQACQCEATTGLGWATSGKTVDERELASSEPARVARARDARRTHLCKRAAGLSAVAGRHRQLVLDRTRRMAVERRRRSAVLHGVGWGEGGRPGCREGGREGWR